MFHGVWLRQQDQIQAHTFLGLDIHINIYIYNINFYKYLFDTDATDKLQSVCYCPKLATLTLTPNTKHVNDWNYKLAG